VADALSRRYVLLFTLIARLLRFENIKELYNEDNDFDNVYNAYDNSAFSKFYRLDKYLFKENCLCVPLSFMHGLLWMYIGAG
jgi:hypothetical protein